MVRLKGGPSDAETLGELVWAPGYQGLRWPGEMLDPFRLPPSRSLPVLAIQGGCASVHALSGRASSQLRCMVAVLLAPNRLRLHHSCPGRDAGPILPAARALAARTCHPV